MQLYFLLNPNLVAYDTCALLISRCVLLTSPGSRKHYYSDYTEAKVQSQRAGHTIAMWGGSPRPLEGPLGEVRVKETEDEEERKGEKR